MMLFKIDKPNHLRGKYSVFIKLDIQEFESNKMIIKSYRGYYDKQSHIWELPYKSYKVILDKCRDIRICGELPKEVDLFIEQLDKFDIRGDYSPKTVPFSYQKESYEYSEEHSKFLLGDEQGLGKTKQALDIAISRKSKFHHCLIVCGVNELKWNWVKEISIHTNEQSHILGLKENGKIGSVQERLEDLKKPHDEFFIITNIETLRDKAIGEELKKQCENNIIGMTIIDEFHKCKNYSSQQGKAIHNCCSYYKLALTGTPIMNNAIDLYNLLKWLEVENHTLTEFKSRYCIMGGFGGYQIVGYRHLEYLHKLLDTNMLRRLKNDVLDLPPKIHTDELLEMNDKQIKLYNDVHNQIRDNIDKIILLPNPLTELIRLRQVTGNPSILTSDNIQSVKFNRMKEIVEEVVANKGKVIIFSNWTKVIIPARDMLKEYNPAMVIGETKDSDSQINKFKNDSSCKIILGTISCLGTGFTLTEANTVIFLDEPWTMAEKEQAEDRCYRIGTRGTVNIITLMCKNTVDERIHNIVMNKKAMSDKLVDNKKIFKEIMEV